MTSYFIHDGLNHSGPFSLQELQAKTIVADTPVWTEGLGDWSTAKEIPELVTVFNLRPTPPPFQGARKPGVIVVPPFNEAKTVSGNTSGRASHTGYQTVQQGSQSHDEARHMPLVSDYDQDLYQMEMENYFTEDSHRRRNQLGIAAAVIVLGSLAFWLFKLMAA